jgi:hopene-associated glycosyltransferase HpnB
VFFFALLYPFAWINDREHRIAAAAGGCILIKRETLERIGGLDSIRGEMIDDCALAAAVKHSGGGIWLGLTQETRSLRRYPRLADIWNMVARTAYTQLRHSPWLLGATVASMALAYVAPPLLLSAGGIAAWLGGAAWLLMVVAYLPMVRFYRLSPLWSLLLPAIALVYVAATIDSARRYREGKGGQWKGRVAWRNAR